MSKSKYNVGDKVGNFEVLELVKSDKGLFYKTRCVCGNIVLYRCLQLTKNESCGCLTYDKGFIGRKFGRLTVVSFKENKNARSLYNCICTCGTEKAFRKTELLYGHTSSCGCYKKYYEKNIAPETLKGNLKEGTNIAKIKSNKVSKANKSGYKGVTKRGNKWAAALTFKKKVYQLGAYYNKEEAIKARKEAEEKYFKPIIDKYKNE